jgi:hypothetical protein
MVVEGRALKNRNIDVLRLIKVRYMPAVNISMKPLSIICSNKNKK